MARISVVDDEAAVRRLVADILSFDGHEVELASDGAEALRLVEQRVYDLILSDLRMPNLDGPGQRLRGYRHLAS